MSITENRWQDMDGMNGMEARPSDMVMGTGMEPPSPPVAMVLDDLNRAVAVLREDLGLLYDKLTPVQTSGDQENKASATDTRDIPGSSEVVRIIADVVDRISAMTDRVRSEKGRLEL